MAQGFLSARRWWHSVAVATVVWTAAAWPQATATAPAAQAGSHTMVAAYQAASATSPAAGAPSPSAGPVHDGTDATAQGTLIRRYCVGCHNPRLKTAGLVLDPADLQHVADRPETWEKVIARLRSGAMPPPNAPRPDAAAIGGLTTWIEHELDGAAAAHPDPGRTNAFHRLNRAEYHNAVRDLLALDLDVAALLPGDDIDEQGFDNMGEVLTISPALFERYLSSARKIARLAVGRPPLGPSLDSYKTALLLTQDDRMSDDLPFGSRGGLSFAHYFPVDGEYEIRVRLQRNYVNYIRGLGTPQQLEVRIDGGLVKRFTVGGERTGKPAPASYAGNIFGDDSWERYALEADAGLVVRLPVSAGPRTVGIAFVRNLVADEGVQQPRQSVFAAAINDMRDGHAAVEEVTVGGPHASSGPGDTPSRRQIFACRPARASEEAGCAKRILATLARHAYRRPVGAADVDTLMRFYTDGRREGSFDAGIAAALERLLIAPDFLFRVERDPANAAAATAYPVSDLELASRLSFFLWSSIPDDELLQAAERNTLHETAVLKAQVQRMLADPRARALVDNFAGQWLRLRDLASIAPDPVAFPDFDENLRDAFRRETELFVDSQIRENHSIADLLSADYTFVNERLARHYGIANVYGSHFRRITLDAQQAAVRGGILGQSSLLTVTSYPNRTSPVLRGKWVLANVIGAPPPPPPANVPDLPAKGPDGRAATVRDRMAEHRKNAVCSVCHAPMDPIGLVLENYDALGGWRDKEGELPIDATGVLPDGSRVAGPAGLKALLQQRRDQFVRTATEKLLSYALGRSVGLRGRTYVRQIVNAAADDDYRWSATILAIVESAPFRMRRSAS